VQKDFCNNIGRNQIHAVQQKKLLDCRVGELLELPRHVKATHLRGFHVD